MKNAEGFEAECRQGMEMGFDGKTLIHPSQVEPANDMWAPSAADVEYAERVIAAFDEAVADGRGVVTVDGRMIENLHVANARRHAGRRRRDRRRSIARPSVGDDARVGLTAVRSLIALRERLVGSVSGGPVAARRWRSLAAR